MLHTIRAIYEQGRLRLLDPVELAEGQQVSVTIQPADEKAAVRAALGDTVRWAKHDSHPDVDIAALRKSVQDAFTGVRSLTELVIEERREGR